MSSYSELQNCLFLEEEISSTKSIYDLTYISFGAGVQSTALLIMSALGLNDCPKADIAIFADTGDEPSWVYEYLEILKPWGKENGIPIVTCSHGCLSEDTLSDSPSSKIPFWVQGKKKKVGMLRRKCTRDYKIIPIQKKVREVLGLKKGERAKGKKQVACFIGISIDEASRMKDSQVPWINISYPLVDASINRNQCKEIIRKAGLPVPGKSSCVFCPYHNNQYWRKLKQFPDEWQRAVDFDEKIRKMPEIKNIHSLCYLHNSLEPISEVDFSENQQDLFEWECEGVCGV